MQKTTQTKMNFNSISEIYSYIEQIKKELGAKENTYTQMLSNFANCSNEPVRSQAKKTIKFRRRNNLFLFLSVIFFILVVAGLRNNDYGLLFIFAPLALMSLCMMFICRKKIAIANGIIANTNPNFAQLLSEIKTLEEKKKAAEKIKKHIERKN